MLIICFVVVDFFKVVHQNEREQDEYAFSPFFCLLDNSHEGRQNLNLNQLAPKSPL